MSNKKITEKKKKEKTLDPYGHRVFKFADDVEWGEDSSDIVVPASTTVQTPTRKEEDKPVVKNRNRGAPDKKTTLTPTPTPTPGKTTTTPTPTPEPKVDPKTKDKDDKYTRAETDPYGTVNWVYKELSETRGDSACWEELRAHFWWFAGSGAILTMMAWPIVRPARVLMPQYLLRIPDSIKKISDIAAANKGKAIRGTVGELTKRSCVGVARYLARIFGAPLVGIAGVLQGALGGVLGGAFRVLATPLTGSKISTNVKQIGTGIAGTSVGALKTVKGLGTTMMAIGLVYHILAKTFGDDEETKQEIKKAEDLGDSLIEWVEATLLAELGLEIGAMALIKTTTGVSSECFWENSLRAAAALTLFGFAGSARGVAPKQLRSLESGIKGARNPDELVAAVRAHNDFQLRALDKTLMTELPKTIDNVSAGFRTTLGGLKGKLSAAQQQQYLKILLDKGPAEASNFLSSSTNLSPKLQELVHTRAVEKANEICTKFTDDYVNVVNQAEKDLGLRSGLSSRAAAIRGNREEVLDLLIQTTRRASQQTVASAKLISAAKLGSNTGLDLAAKNVDGDLLKLNTIMTQMDDVVFAGGDALKAVRAYRNNIIPLMNKNASNLDNLILSTIKTGSKEALSSAKISEMYVQNLKMINQAAGTGFFDDVLVYSTKGSILPNSFSRVKKIQNAQVSARQIVDQLSNQILKANPNLRASDILKLEKELLIFHKNITTAAVKQYKIPALSPGNFFINTSFMLGLSSSVIYYIFRQGTTEEVEIDDILTWQSCELSRALIWEEYSNDPIFSKIEKVVRLIGGDKKTIYTPQFAIDSESESMRTLYEYMYLEKHQVPLKTFLDEYLFNPNELEKKQIVSELDKMIFDFIKDKSFKDFTEKENQKFVFDYANRLTQVDVLNKLMLAWGENSGSQREMNEDPDTPQTTQYRNKYFPIFIKLLVINSSMYENLNALRRGGFKTTGEEFDKKTPRDKVQYIKDNIFNYKYIDILRFAEKCIESEMKRKQLQTFKQSAVENPDWAKSTLGWLGYTPDQSSNITKFSEIANAPETLLNRITYALKPGEFYDERKVSKVPEKIPQTKPEPAVASPTRKRPRRPSVRALPRLKPRSPNASKKYYSIEDAYRLLKSNEPKGKSGLYTEDDIYKLAALSKYESSGNPKVFNGRINTMGDYSYGLWQINMAGRLGPLRRGKYNLQKNEELFDPDVNAKIAWDLFLDGVRITNNAEKDPDYKNKMNQKARARFFPNDNPNKFGHWSPSIETRKGGRKYRAWLKDFQKIKSNLEGGGQMNEIDLKNLVKDMLKENYGKGYTPYPYHSEIGQSDEPAEDFIQDWKDFELSLVRDESRDTAIRVAKVLIKDLELFGDVLDLVGKNQSVATEILKYLRKDEEKS